MKQQKYHCCGCNTIFEDEYYNWYVYYKRGMFHDCPKCKVKLVPNYNFEETGLLDKITIRLLIIAVAACAVSSYFWGFDVVGKLVFAVPAFMAGVVHALYWLSLSGADKKIQETRILNVK